MSDVKQRKRDAKQPKSDEKQGKCKTTKLKKG